MDFINIKTTAVISHSKCTSAIQSIKTNDKETKALRKKKKMVRQQNTYAGHVLCSLFNQSYKCKLIYDNTHTHTHTHDSLSLITQSSRDYKK